MSDRIKANYERDLEQKARDMEEMQKKLAQEETALEKAEEPRRREAEAAKAAKAALSPAQENELSKQLYGAARRGDTAKVLSLIEKGSDMEWQNPDDVSE